MGSQGHTTVNFGAFPGASDAFVDVVSAGVIASSDVEAWIRIAASADHSADEHKVETIKAFGEYLSDGNIRISIFNTSQLNEDPGTLGARHDKAGPRGLGTLIYGLWNVSWVWN